METIGWDSEEPLLHPPLPDLMLSWPQTLQTRQTRRQIFDIEQTPLGELGRRFAGIDFSWFSYESQTRYVREEVRRQMKEEQREVKNNNKPNINRCSMKESKSAESHVEVGSRPSDQQEESP